MLNQDPATAAWWVLLRRRGGVWCTKSPGGASQKRKITDLIGRLPRPGKLCDNGFLRQRQALPCALCFVVLCFLGLPFGEQGGDRQGKRGRGVADRRSQVAEAGFSHIVEVRDGARAAGLEWLARGSSPLSVRLSAATGATIISRRRGVGCDTRCQVLAHDRRVLCPSPPLPTNTTTTTTISTTNRIDK